MNIVLYNMADKRVIWQGPLTDGNIWPRVGDALDLRLGDELVKASVASVQTTADGATLAIGLNVITRFPVPPAAPVAPPAPTPEARARMIEKLHQLKRSEPANG